MEVPRLQEDTFKLETKYFETYEVKPSDIEKLQQGIDIVAHSKLIEEEILNNIRFVTYDSKSLYIFTRGEHVTNGNFSVEEIISNGKMGFKIFKTAHRGFIGKNKEDYRGASAGLLCEEIETTAANAKKFPNQAIPYWPDIPREAREILDVVRIAPYEPFEKINKGRFGYLTDVIFHEVGHIEHRRLENWQDGEEKIEAFPSEEKRAEFLTFVRQTQVFPNEIINHIIENISTEAISEMYAMLIDREAAKRFDAKRFNEENLSFQKTLTNLQDTSINHGAAEQFRESLRWGHATGRHLVRILEEQFSDFFERKQFVRSVLQRKTMNQ